MHHFINVIENGDNSVTKLACRRLTNNLRKRNFRLNSTIPLSDACQLTDKTFNFAFKNFFFYVQSRIRNTNIRIYFLWTHNGKTVHLYSLRRWLNHISVITSALRKRQSAQDEINLTYILSEMRQSNSKCALCAKNLKCCYKYSRCNVQTWNRLL